MKELWPHITYRSLKIISSCLELVCFCLHHLHHQKEASKGGSRWTLLSICRMFAMLVKFENGWKLSTKHDDDESAGFYGFHLALCRNTAETKRQRLVSASHPITTALLHPPSSPRRRNQGCWSNEEDKHVCYGQVIWVHGVVIHPKKSKNGKPQLMGYLMTHVNHVNVKILLTIPQYVGIQSRIIQCLTMAQVVIHTPLGIKHFRLWQHRSICMSPIRTCCSTRGYIDPRILRWEGGISKSMQHGWGNECPHTSARQYAYCTILDPCSRDKLIEASDASHSLQISLFTKWTKTINQFQSTSIKTRQTKPTTQATQIADAPKKRVATAIRNDWNINNQLNNK